MSEHAPVKPGHVGKVRVGVSTEPGTRFGVQREDMKGEWKTEAGTWVSPGNTCLTVGECAARMGGIQTCRSLGKFI